VAEIKLSGKAVNTNGDLPRVGSQAPDFLLTNEKLVDTGLSAFRNKKKLLSIVPSLDTEICATSTKKFNEFASDKKNEVAVLVISADLPFAINRFCGTEEIKNIYPLSMMRDKKFAKDYGVLLQDGPLKGITARAIVVLDQDNKVIYTELVPDITREPDYQSAIAALEN
jgi:thiol peroxidase